MIWSAVIEEAGERVLEVNPMLVSAQAELPVPIVVALLSDAYIVTLCAVMVVAEAVPVQANPMLATAV